MHVLITGGTGLIGTALSRSLLQDGHRVNILSRGTSPKVPAGAETVHWDARSPQGWAELVNEVDAVVNLAGENLAGNGPMPERWTEARKLLLRDSRLQASRAVAAAIATAARPPRVLVQASGVGYYGPLGEEPVDESAPPGNDFLARLCVDWEDTGRSVEERGVRRAMIRTGAVLSAQGGALPKLVLPYRWFVGGPVGNGRQYMAWIHIDDEVGAIRFLLDHTEASGAFNLTAPGLLTNREFGEVLGRVLHRPSLMPLPGFWMRALFGEVASVLLEGQRALPKRLQSLGYAFKYPELEGALRNLLQD